MLDRTVTELNRASLKVDPTRTVTFERVEMPEAVTVWRVRYRNDDGSHRGTTTMDPDRAAAIFRQWTEGQAAGEPELFPPIPLRIAA